MGQRFPNFSWPGVRSDVLQLVIACNRKQTLFWCNPSGSREIDEASRSVLVFQTSRMICIDMQICEQ